MAQIQTNQIQSFGEALLVIIAYVLVGYFMQRVGYLIPEWYNQSELKHGQAGHTKFMSWFQQQYKQLLIFIPIKYVGNVLYYIVLPFQYFQILSTSLTAYHSIDDGDDYLKSSTNNSFFYQNLIICLTAKLLLLVLSALFSMCLFYSTKRKKKSHQQTGILTNEQDVTKYMVKYRQCLLHDHPLAKWCVFGLFATSTYDIAIGIPLIKSIYSLQENTASAYTQYIYLYNLIQLLIIVPFCLLLLDIAVLSVQKKYRKLRQQEMIMKQTMAFQRQESNDMITKSMDLTVLTDCDEKAHHKTAEEHDDDILIYEEEDSEQYEEEDNRQKSAALNVFLSSINKVQLANQELQEKEEIQRIARLKQLANLPLTTPTGSIGPNSLLDEDEYNTPYEPTHTFTSDNEMNESHKNTMEKNSIRHRRRSSTKSSMDAGNSITANIKRKSMVSRRVSIVSSPPNNKKHNGLLSVCKRLMGKIILNPIIIASVCALICKALVSHSTLLSLSVYLNKVSSIYEFVGLYIVGALLAIFFEQRLNIFKFAAANHQNKENTILLKINENKNKKTAANNSNNSFNNNVFTPNLPEYDHDENNIFAASMRAKLQESEERETNINIWTYTHNTQTGGINFTQKRMTRTDIEEEAKAREKKETVKVSSISLMNTDNVMMWWWSLSFVLFRYLISSLSFRFISFAIYGYLCPVYVHRESKEMEVINYLYGTLTPNLLSLIIAMKYNIYISFITVSYMISIVLYPVIVFCGLLLFTDVQFDAMKRSVEFVVFTVHICSIIAAFVILVFWYGFKHWRTYPITIFMAILVMDVAYNSSNLLCEYYEYFYENDSNKMYILFIVYFLRQWVRLLLLSAAFQSCLLISGYSILKRELKTYHCIMQPIIFVLSLIIASLLWFIRYKNKFPFGFSWEYPVSDFANKYNVQCQYSSSLQLQIDLIIQCMNTLLLIVMFWYILKKRYQYEIHSRAQKKNSNRSMWLQICFCCYLKCCCCDCGETNPQNKHKKIKKTYDNDTKEPLLSDSQTTKINGDNNENGTQPLDPNSIVIELRKKSDINYDDVVGYNYNNNNEDVNNVPDVLMVDGKNVEIQSEYVNYKNKSKISIEYVYEARIDCDPNSLETYYQFDYYATTLIILCVALIGFIANVIFIVFLLRSHLYSFYVETSEDPRILELLMLLSVFQHGQTFFIAILFLSAKPIKRLSKNFWTRLRSKCQSISQEIKVKVDDDDDDEDTFGDDTRDMNDDYNDDTFDTNEGKRKLEENTEKTVSLPRQFYHKLPVLW